MILAARLVTLQSSLAGNWQQKLDHRQMESSNSLRQQQQMPRQRMNTDNVAVDSRFAARLVHIGVADDS